MLKPLLQNQCWRAKGHDANRRRASNDESYNTRRSANGDTGNNREDYMSGMWRRTCASNGTPRSKYRKTILWLFQFPEVQIHIKYC